MYNMPRGRKEMKERNRKKFLWKSRGVLGVGNRICKAAEELVKVWDFILRTIIIIKQF